MWLYSTQVRGYLLHPIRGNVVRGYLLRPIEGTWLYSTQVRGYLLHPIEGMCLYSTQVRGYLLHPIEGTWLYSTQVRGYLLHPIRGNVAVIIIINPLTARVVGAPQMILQPVFSIFPCSPLPSAELQACPFPDVVFPPLLLSALSFSPFHCALQDGFGQT